MGPGRREGPPQVVLGEHVRNGVVDENSIEGAPEPDGAHVADVVVDAGVEPNRVGQHRFGEVDGGRVELAREVGQVVAPADSELEEVMASGPQLVAKGGAPVLGLLGVVLGRIDQRPEVRELVVHPGALAGHFGHYLVLEWERMVHGLEGIQRPMHVYGGGRASFGGWIG